ncbi:recombinase family protein [Vibrio parahaemolyticus]|nr:recombinase family protein [Vibrio parahaemolyticus]EHH3639530.1 recombinase family protein [Vibrio parahaemolyticus]EIU6798045.1 recombinase family protein [Vibrio parahaemolyticus]ELA9862143.1 recombinase family protein [Vibrio parahaemolyticus]
MRKVYSYMRFSRPEQAKGTSIERQSNFAEQYALEHGLELDKSLTMMDKGLSAFHGVHKTKGAFGQFLAAVTAGKVPSGSVLVVESLDRLSREDPLIAQAALTDLILSGITVVTAADNQVYSREEIQQNPFKLIMSLVVMIRANEESETKQRRSNAFLKSALNQYQANGKIRRLGSDPSWLDFNKDNDTYSFNERVEVIRRILNLYNQGIGSLKIARQLTEESIPTLSGKRSAWGQTTVANIVKSHALYGMKRINVQGVEYDLEDFYPALITKSKWLTLQQHRTKRSKSMHGRGEVVHLITGHGKGFTTCGYCGGGLGAQTQKQYKRSGEYSRTVTRLHCLTHKETSSCCSSVFLEPIESAVLFAACIGVEPQSLVPTVNNVNYSALIDEVENKVKHIVEQVTAGAPWELFKDAHDKLKLEKQKLIKERDSQKPDVNQSDVQKWVNKLVELADKARVNDKEARLKCRTLINSICKSIVIKLRGHDLKSEPVVTITFVTDEQFEFKVGKNGAVQFVDNGMAVNRRLKPLLA